MTDESARLAEEPTHPGPQQVVARRRSVTIVLSALIAVVALLMVHTILRSNYAVRDAWDPRWIWRLRTLDLSSGTALLVGLVSLLALRGQFLAARRPYVVYECFPRGTTTTPLEHADRYWVAKVLNHGGGPAIVRQATYEVWLEDGDTWDTFGPTTDSPVPFLQRHGLRVGLDYSMAPFSDGSTLGVDAQRWVLEATREFWRKVRRFDITLEFEDLFKDRYRKDIWAIPRRGISEFIVDADDR